MRPYRLMLALLAVASAARADEPRDWDDAREDEDGFWSGVAHPNRARYRELVQQARLVLTNQPQAQEGEKLLLEAISLEPDEPAARWLLAEHYQRNGRHGDCAEQRLAIVKADPSWKPPDSTSGPSMVAFQAGYCLTLANRLEEAIEQYGRVIAAGYAGLDPSVTEAVVHWNLGDSYHALGRLEEAIEEYERGLAGDRGEAMLWFAIGVAYDRDEQISRARDAMLAGLKLPNGMARLITGEHVVYVPPEDQEYYIGLAHQTNFEEQGAVGARLHAILRFRRYLAAVPDGEPAWAARARAHLAELGKPVVTEREIELRPANAADRQAIVKAVVAAGPTMQKCLEGKMGAAVMLEITLAPAARQNAKAKGKPVRPALSGMAVQTTGHGPVAPSSADLACVTEKANQLKLPLPSKGVSKVIVHLIAP